MVVKQTAPGNSWTGANRGTIMTMRANNAGDSVRLWEVDYSTTGDVPVTTVSYLPGTLTVKEATDENGHKTVSYTNMQGQTILVKQQLDTAATGAYRAWLCTYYVYDEMGLLKFVLPPKAVGQLAIGNWQLSTVVLNELCYQYKYDDLHRPIEKKVPGADWSYMVYDQRNRPVFVQDATLRLPSFGGAGGGQWAYTLYDAIDRPVQTGLMTLNITRDSLQHYVDAHTGQGDTAVVTTTDSTVKSIPTDPVYPIRDVGIGQYKATHSIAFENGFESEDNADFETEIVAQQAGAVFTTATTITDNPLPPQGVTTALNLLYYDNYTQANKTFDNSQNSKLDIGSNTSYTEAMPTTYSLLLRGKATSSKTRVIEDPADLAKGRWMETVSYYDKYGRVIQTLADNYKGGQDVGMVRYDYTGKALCSYSLHSNPAATVNNLRVKTNMDYDRSGRLLQVTKQLNDNDSTKRVIQRNVYNELGQLATKKIGQKTSEDVTAMEVQDYSYTLRGWLASLNWTSPSPSQGGGLQSGAVENRWFGYKMNYDNGSTAQYNGNISSIQWQSDGDKAERSYTYAYDAVNRLLAADFNQKFGSTWAKTDGSFTIDYSVKMGDGVHPETAYDENGNIKSMTQKGLLLNTSSNIDSLQYNYAVNSNKLMSVTDLVTTNNKLGDFTDGNTTGDDYTYNNSGSLTADKNKGHTIAYNQFNLPYKITIPGKGDITYIYSATGAKLEKRTHILHDSTNHNEEITKATAYISGYIYQDNQLQFFGHEEGRIRIKDSLSGGFVYDYFLKDHLGNIRTVLTEEQKTDAYPPATMELENEQRDTALYSNILTTRSDKPPGYPVDTAYTNPNIKVAKLDGVNKKIGPGITLKVMAGDKFNIRVSSWYRQGTTTPSSPSNPLTDLLAALVNGVSGSATTAHGTVTATALNNSGVLPPGATQFLNNQTYSSGKPKAYLNWILFDEHFKYDSANSGFEQVGDDTVLTIHTKSDLLIGKNGYLYVYVSNVTGNIPVYFDNLQVSHVKGPLLEEDHYYPFGLQMKSICSKAANSLENRFKFNAGTELNGDFDLSLYETPLRPYDAQTGRFTGIDILAEKRVWLSTYQFCRDNPIKYNDFSGALEGYAAELWNGLVAHVNAGGSINDIEIGGQSVDCLFFGSGGGGGEISYGSFSGNSFNEVYTGLRAMGHEPPITAGLVRSMMESQGNYSYANGLGFQNKVSDANGGFDIQYGSDYQVNDNGQLYSNSYFRSTESIKSELDFIYGLYKDGVNSGLQIFSTISESAGIAYGATYEINAGAQVLANNMANTSYAILKGGALAKNAGTAFPIVGALVTGVDAAYNGKWENHHSLDLGINAAIYAIAELSGPVGWILGTGWFVANIIYQQSHEGKTITEDYFNE